MQEYVKEVLEEHRGKEEIYDFMTEYAMEKEGELGYEELDEIEQNCFFLGKLFLEVNHGGFDQYFLSTSGAYAKDTVEFLDQIGENRFPKLLEEGISIHRAVIPDDQKIAEFERLDQKFYEMDASVYEQLYDRFIDYLKRIE